MKECFALRLRQGCGIFLLLVAGKAAYIAWSGVTYEFDSLVYLEHVPAYHHPPLYSLFLYGLRGLWPDAYFLALAQTSVFALGATLFIAHFVRDTRGRWLLAALLAVEPVTGLFCANLMSEALFLGLLLVWSALLSFHVQRERESGSTPWIVALALLSALLYATRLAAVILPGFVVLLIWLRRPGLRRALVETLVLLAVFQLGLVPFKLLFLEHYGKFSLSMFTGTNLWNNASVLYPDSDARRNPTTEFERFLAGRDPAEFSTRSSLRSNTLDGPQSAYYQYTTSRAWTPSELNEFERSLARTSERLILRNPWGYLVRFVVPSFLQPLTTDDEIAVTADVDARMRELLRHARRGHVRYGSGTWKLWFGLLVAATAANLAPRFRDRGACILLGLCWYYLLVLPALTAMFLRYVLICVPLILTAAYRTAAGARARRPTPT